MPIIGNVARRSFKVRFLNTTIHVILIVGAVTMIYPFLITLSGSVKSRVDSQRLNVIPAYFYDDDMLYRKYIESKYLESIGTMSTAYRDVPPTFADVEPPAKPSATRYEDWNAFLDETPGAISPAHYLLGHSLGDRTRPEMRRRFVDELKEEVDGDLMALNTKYGTTFKEWTTIGSPIVNLVMRETSGTLSPFMKRITEFADKQSRGAFIYNSLDSLFVETAMRPLYATIQEANEKLRTSFHSWADIRLSRHLPEGPLRDMWADFVRNRLNLRLVTVSDEALPDYHAFLENKYDGRIELLNDRYAPDPKYTDFSEVPLVQSTPDRGVILSDWDEFIITTVKVEHLGITSIEFMYRDFLERKYGTIEALIAAHDLGLQEFDDLVLTEKLPRENIIHAEDWTTFVRSHIDSGWVGPDPGARRDWIQFLTKPYTTIEKVKKPDAEIPEDATEAETYTEVKTVDMEALNASLGTNYANTRKIAIPLKKPSRPKLAERWLEFVREICPPELLLVNVADGSEAWREFIRDKYGTVAEINRQYGLMPAGFHQVELPLADVDWFSFVEDKRHIFWEFLTRNYAIVIETVVSHGRAILNTIIYCALAIITALTVNPLAAYAMSRYKPPSQYKLLLLLMLTMAFPPMVLGIPNFLLLRDLHLLNTFAALVLPGMANGYMIFLLKGFFDALPRELYESAQLDGASEWTMFWHITMATSKPILAVIALGAFTGAYSNFLFAMIVCQNPKMWTLMVHVYQMQQSFAQPVVFASVVICAIPTLLVFIFCQNIIIRGIVVPTEK